MKKILYLMIMLVIGLSSRADVITAEQARSVASQFFGGSVTSNRSKANINLSEGRLVDNNLYIFNRGENQGFVIVSAWDGTPDVILGYSDDGYFDYDSAPDNARWLIDQYSMYIDSLRVNGISHRCMPSVPLRKPSIIVEPLIKTKWNQGAPYNGQTPVIDGVQTLTGCVPTAVAQFMNFYQWPPAGMGEHTNTWATGEHRDFRHAYNWDNLDVAELMADIGTAMNAQYGVDETPTYVDMYALITYFGYAHIENDPTIDRSNYKITDEYKEELDAGRPVFYSGKLRGVVDDPRGHLFLIDGYAEGNLFHVNVGWGGGYDGYYHFCLFDDYANAPYYTPPYGGLTHVGPCPAKRFEVNGAIYEVTGTNEVKMISFPETEALEIEVGGTVQHEGVSYSVVSFAEAAHGRGIANLRVKGTIKHIDDELFYYSPSIKNVILEEGVESIGRHAFSLCDLESITYGESLKYIDDCAFWNTKIKNFTLKKNVKLGSKVFSFGEIDNLTVDAGVEEIADSAFCQSSVKTLSLPPTLKRIGNSAFDAVYTLKTLSLPDGVEIGDRAFLNAGVQEIINIESAKAIGQSAFMGNVIPKIISFKSIERLGAYGLGTGVERVTLPATLKELGARNADHYDISKDNPYLMSEHGIAYSKDKTTLIDYPRGAVHDNWPDARMHYYIYVPEGVRRIADYAINDNEVNVYLPSTIEYVGVDGLPKFNAAIYCYAKNPPYFANYMPLPDEGFYDQYYAYKTLYVPYGCSYAYKQAADERYIKWMKISEIDPEYIIPNESLWGTDININGVVRRYSYFPNVLNIHYEDGKFGTNFMSYDYDLSYDDMYSPSNIREIKFIDTDHSNEYLEINFSDRSLGDYTLDVVPLRDVRTAKFTDNSMTIYGEGNNLIKTIQFQPQQSYYDYYRIYYSKYDGTKTYKIKCLNVFGYSHEDNMVFDQFHEFKFDTSNSNPKFIAVHELHEGFRNMEYNIDNNLCIKIDQSKLSPLYPNVYILTKDGKMQETALSSLKEIAFSGSQMRLVGTSGSTVYSVEWKDIDQMYFAIEPMHENIYDYSDPEAKPRHTQYIYVQIGDGWKEIPMVDAQIIPFDGSNLLIDGVAYPVEMIKRISLTKPKQPTQQTYTITDLCPQIKTDDYSIQFSPSVIEGEMPLSVNFRYPEDLAKEEGVRRALGYEITLGDDIHQLDGVVEIRIPMQVSDDCVAAGTWYNTETNEWEPAYSYYDDITKEVVIISDHLTWYGAIECTREFYRNGKVTFMLLPNINQQLSTMANSLQELANNNKFDTSGVDSFLSDVGDYMQICGDVGFNSIKAAGIEAETLSGLNDKIIGPLGITLSVFQIISADYNDKDAEVAGQTLKLIFNQVANASASWIGSAMMTGCMASVAWIDYVINKFGTTAWESRTDLYRAAMSRYYSRGHDGYRSYKQWYDLIYPIYTRPGITVEQLKEEVDRLVSEHSWKFWQNESTVAYYLNEARGLGWTGGGGLNESMKRQLSKEYYDMLMHYEVKTVMEQMKRKFEAQAYARASTYNKQMQKWLNTMMTLDLYDSTMSGSNSKYAGCKVRFKVMPQAVKDPNNWETTLDYEGKGQIKYRMFPFLFNNFKPVLVVIDADGNVVREIEYQHGDKGATIDVSSGITDGIRWENATKVPLNIKMDPSMYESDILMRWTGKYEKLDDYGLSTSVYEYDELYPSKLDWSECYSQIRYLMSNLNTQLSGKNDEHLIVDYSGMKMERFYDKETRQGYGTFTIDLYSTEYPNDAQDIIRFYRALLDGDPMTNPAPEDYDRYLYGNTILDCVVGYKITGNFTVTGSKDGQFAYHFTGSGNFEVNGNYLSGLDNFIPMYLYDDIQPVTNTFRYDGKVEMDETFIY